MKTRSRQLEYLDAEQIPVKDLHRNLYELDRINTLLGGHQITLDGFKQGASILGKTELRVVELGSGGGDNLRVLARYARKQNWKVAFTGVDLKPDCTAYAKEHSKEFPEISWVTDDYRNYTSKETTDIVFSSLFCHHLDEKELVAYFNWNRRHARFFFVNDLHRDPIARWSIKMLSSLFSKSYLVKNDAPLSVARSFRKEDWVTALKGAEIEQYDLKWRWAFRWLLTARGDKR